MKIKLIKVFVYMMLIFLFAFRMKDIKEADSTHWVSVDYIECMKTKLPCECSNLFIELDTNKSSRNFGVLILDGSSREFNGFDIEKESNGGYKILGIIEDTIEHLGLIKIKNDTLYHTDFKNTISRLVNYSQYQINTNHPLLNLNIGLLNYSFESRGYPSLEKTLKQNTLSCNCNIELGGINVIYGNKKAWIIEQSKDSILIYDYLNSRDDKAIPIVINKKLFKKYKW